MLTTAAAYDLTANNLTRSLENTARQPVVARDAEYYLENISKITSVDDFMADDRLYRFAMKAHGLEDMAYAKAFMRKALEEGIDKNDSFANSLADSRYREFVEVFNFERYGETAVAFDRTKQGTVDKFIRQTLEEDAGAQNEAVRLALYFERKAPEINSAYDILADRALISVVQTALGIPSSSSQQNIDRQAENITSRLDLEDLKDPEKLKSFIRRFAALWDAQNGQPAAAAAPQILIGAPIEIGISADLLTQLQSLGSQRR